jgi:small subunit ribosomal protein S21
MENSTRQPAWKRSERRNEEHTVGHLEVVVIDNNIERALRDLKNKMSREGVLAELKKRRHAEKPSEKLRRKHREAIKRNRKSRGRKARVREQVRRNAQ